MGMIWYLFTFHFCPLGILKGDSSGLLMWQGKAHGQAKLQRQVVSFKIWTDVGALIWIIHHWITNTPHPLRPEDESAFLHKRPCIRLAPWEAIEKEKILHASEVVNISKMLWFNIWNDVDALIWIILRGLTSTSRLYDQKIKGGKVWSPTCTSKLDPNHDSKSV